MSRFDANGLALSFINVMFSVVLVLGVYLSVMFFKKMITYGRGQSQYKELVIGILLIALGIVLKIMLVWY